MRFSRASARDCAGKTAAPSSCSQSEPPHQRSELRSAAEPELLNAIVRTLCDRDRIIEPQRTKGRIPNKTCTNGRAYDVGIVNNQRFAGLRESRWPPIIPKRTGVSINRAADTRVLGYEVERDLEFKAGAPVIGAAERILNGADGNIARAKTGGREAAHQ